MIVYKYSSIFLTVILVFTFFIPNTSKVFASPQIVSATLNGLAQNVFFNPNNGESISIQIKANIPVKFTRLYICSVSQICNGTSGNYTKYFTQTDILDTIIKSWDGKNSAGTMSLEGEYKIMASMLETGANEPITEFAPYSITISFSSQNQNGTDIATTTSNQNTEIIKTVTRNVYVSTHSNSEELSDYNKKSGFEITAGRERTALVGTFIEFDAKYTISDKDQCIPTFRWSFGDGFESIGKNITHIYKYIGEYQVVLNANCGDYNSISRTSVIVSSPTISISNLSTRDIEIFNKSKVEINIGNWEIKGIKKYFVFPKDTIISANNKIVLSKEDLGITSLDKKIYLNNPSGGEEAYFNNENLEQQNLTSVSLNETDQNSMKDKDISISVKEAEVLIMEYKKNLIINKPKISEVEKIYEPNVKIDLDETPVNDETLIQISTVAEAIKNQESKGFWSKLTDFPVKNIKAFIGMFYNF